MRTKRKQRRQKKAAKAKQVLVKNNPFGVLNDIKAQLPKRAVDNHFVHSDEAKAMTAQLKKEWGIE